MVNHLNGSRSNRLKRVLIVLALCMIAGRAQAYTVEIPQEELQAAVATVFPIKQQVPFAAAVFSDPKIRIVAGSTRLRLAVTVNATIANQATSTGWAEIEGEPDYDPGTGEFHLRQPAVTALHFDSLPQEYLDLMRTVVNTMATQIVPGIVIYRLDELDFRQGMMRRVLKRVSVRDGKLIAEMEW